MSNPYDEYNQKVTWKYESDYGDVVFDFSVCEMNAQELFMKWVQFCNAIGYVLDAREMESLWNGEYDDSEETELLKAQIKGYQARIEDLLAAVQDHRDSFHTDDDKTTEDRQLWSRAGLLG